MSKKIIDPNKTVFERLGEGEALAERLGKTRAAELVLRQAAAESLAVKIKAAREAVGEDQDTFALHLEVSVWRLRRLEQGNEEKSKDPRWSFIQKIASYLHVSTDLFRNL